MKAVLCKAFCPPDTLVYEDVPSPVPGKGEVVVTVRAASVNVPDVLIIENKYQFKPPLPFSPGSELAGVVKSVGEGVSRFKPGDKVIAFTGAGAFAEEVKTEAERLIPMPEGMEDVTRLPKITEELLRRGYTEPQIKGILGENVLRLMERVEAVSREIRNEAKAPR